MAARYAEGTRKLGRVEGMRATQSVALCPRSLRCSTCHPWVQVQTGHPIPRGESSVYRHLCSGAAEARGPELSRAGLVPRTSASPSG